MPRWFYLLMGIALIGAIGGIVRYNISQSGINKLKRREAWRAYQYLDQAGKPTIGWGHLIRKGEVFNEPISTEQGEALLKKDLAEAEAAINRLVKVPLNQNQYDALVNLVFNIGVTGFEYGGPNRTHSTVLKRLNAGDYAGAADAFRSWNKITVNGAKVVSGGLVDRREEERGLFLA